MDPFSAMQVASMFSSGTGGDTPNSTTATTPTGANAFDVGGILGNILGGVTKFIGCLGKQAWTTGVLDEARNAVDGVVRNIKSERDAENALNDFAAIVVSMPAHRDSMKNACTKENMDIYTNYVKSVRENMLRQFDVQEIGISYWNPVGNYPHGEKSGLIQKVRVIGMKSSTVPVFPDLPVNGGVGQGEYQPPVPTPNVVPTPDNGTYYTKDEIDTILNSQLKNNLASNDVQTLQQLQTMLNAKPNCKGGIVNGKPYLDCSVTNDNTQNMIQVAGLALTALGLIWMVTKKK